MASATNTCQVVPQGPREQKCTRPWRDWGEGSPRLCKTHHNEYVKLTMGYRELHDTATRVYQQATLALLDRTGEVKLVSDIREVEKALAVADRCHTALDQAIDAREAHHRRFFPQVDQGHRTQIWLLHGRRDRMRTISGTLAARKNVLLQEARERREVTTRNRMGQELQDVTMTCWELSSIADGIRWLMNPTRA